MAKIHTLVDHFGDDSIDTTRWYAYGPVQEVNQRIEIRPVSGVSGSYGGIGTATAYDLRDSQVSVELVRPLRNTAGAETYVVVLAASGDRVTFKVQQGLLYCSRQAAGAPSATRLAQVAYDPAAHRWMRIREQLGVMYFEHSGDGCAWTVLASLPTPFNVSAVEVEVAAGTFQAVPAPGVAIFDNFNAPEARRARRVEERRDAARDLRVEAAELAAARRHDEHANNNDEVNYPTRPYVGSYSKSLKHDSLGDPDPASYGSLLRALQSEDPGDFEEIQLASSTAVKLVNPQAGLAFDLEAPDAQAITQPPAPRFDSEVAAHEMGELYWMAVLRDVPFNQWPVRESLTTSEVYRAIQSLNDEFPQFGGTVPVTARNLFRGIYPGEQVGPYVSQFLWKGNADPRKPDGAGKDADEGFITYGAQVIDQRQLTVVQNVDYLTGFSTWLDVQNGVDTRGQDQFDTQRRFIRSLRDGANFVHFDQVLNAFYNAAFILMSEPAGNQITASAGARPMIDLEFAKDQGNPYDPPGSAMDSRTQVGFATFGPTHLLQVLAEVLGRALRAVWWQKWGVHRRLRPEEYGGRVDNWIVGRRDYPLHSSIKNSLMTGKLALYFGGQAGDQSPAFPSYLLPQAYPEGAPTHPAYGAGHATGSGACVTILKALFDESKTIENPLQASADGLTLVPYTGADASQMTVGGELNKLAGNIALFRNAAGVHWRSDYTESLPLGEAIAIGLLQEMSLGFNEDDAFFELTKFDGTTIRIFDGKVVPVVS
jgi:hypothetical protein